MWAQGDSNFCCVTISNTGKRAVYYDWGRHNFLRALTEFVNMRRGTRKSIKLAFLTFSKLGSFFAPHLKTNSQEFLAHVL